MEQTRNLVMQAADPAAEPEQRLSAFGLLVQRFQDMACGYAYSILGDFHRAEDAAQEAFVAACWQIESLREPAARALRPCAPAPWGISIDYCAHMHLDRPARQAKFDGAQESTHRRHRLPTLPLRCNMDAIMSQPSQDPHTEPSPVIEMNVPCPGCRYNLRGLAGPLCPECGRLFEPARLCEEHLRERRRVPSAAWVIRAMRRHPIAFWSMPPVRLGEPPEDLAAAMTMRILGWGLAPIVVTTSAVAGIVAGAMVALIMAIAGHLAISLSIAIHGALCRLVLGEPREGGPRYDAEGLVAYSSAWARYYVCGMVVLGLTAFIGGKLLAVAPLLALLSLIALPVLAVIVLWGIALYRGAVLITAGNRARALWCVLSNPFWWPIWLLAIVAT